MHQAFLTWRVGETGNGNWGFLLQKSQAVKGNVKLLQGSLIGVSAKAMRLYLKGRAALTTTAYLTLLLITTVHRLELTNQNYKTTEQRESSGDCSYNLQPRDSLSSQVCAQDHGLLAIDQASYGCRSQNHHRALLCTYVLDLPEYGRLI